MSSGNERRLPAEWEPVEAVLMAWPHKDTDWLYMLPQAEECFAAMVRAIAPFAKVLIVAPDPDRVAECIGPMPDDRVVLLPCQTNDTWTRDYGPITVVQGDANIPVDFGFNGWGLKFAANHDNLVTTALEGMGLFAHAPESRRAFILEGGSIDTDGRGFILTTSSCLLSPNRNPDMELDQILEYICRSLGADRIESLRHGALVGDDTDGHIDTLARLLPPGDVIVYTGCADPSDPNYAELKAMEAELRELRTAEGKPFHLAELPLPDPMYDHEGKLLPATYANFLIVNRAVIVPVYSQPLKDKMAVDILAALLPDHTVVPVDCCALVQQHGSLHCSTMQLPCGTLTI